MTKEEEKDKLNDDNSANTDTQKNNISFLNRLKQQVKTLNFKNEKQEIADENITQVDNEIVLEEELPLERLELLLRELLRLELLLRELLRLELPLRECPTPASID